MELLGKQVIHISYGEGICNAVDENANRITVEFPQNGEKVFPLFDAFDRFYTFADETLNEQMRTEVERRRAEQASRDEEEARRRKEQERQREQQAQLRDRQQNGGEQRERRRAEKPNIAFKCTFCDGGATPTRIGFGGVCSNANRNYNIEVRHATWCSAQQCICRQMYDGNAQQVNEEFVCYESRMLLDWEAQAGERLNGDHNGEPIHLRNLAPNSLAILTTRLPDMEEAQRIIFGVFIVEEVDEGDGRNAGHVYAHPRYRLELTPDEAMNMPYWLYHCNDENPADPRWASGLFRYVNDIEAAQILNEIARIKGEVHDGDLAEEMCNYFCTSVGINRTTLPPPSGALTL